MFSSNKLWSVLLLLSALPACYSDRSFEVPTSHIVMYDGDGDAVDPRWHPSFPSLPYRKMQADETSAYLKKMSVDIESYITDGGFSFKRYNQKTQELELASGIASADRAQPRLVVFIHGGLNTQAGTIERATSLYRCILHGCDGCDGDECLSKNGSDEAFPIFVNWQSNLFSSYWTHLMFVRQGQDWGPMGMIAAPFVFARDAVRAAINVPFGIYHEVDSFVKGSPGYLSADQQRAYSVAMSMEKGQLLESQGHLTDDERENLFPFEFLQNPSEGDPDAPSLGFRTTRFVVQLPFRVVSGSIINGLGKGAWDVMYRRVDLLFERQDQFESGLLKLQPREGFPLFLESLAKLQMDYNQNALDTIDHYEQAKHGLRIDLVVHSMGALVANRILQQHTNRESWTPEFDNLIYMAPACPIGEFQESVLPYLAHNLDAKLYILTLHDKAEPSENYGWGFVPDGSLLVWVDNFLENVRSPQGYALGRFTPLMMSLHMIDTHLRERIHIKSFAAGKLDDTWNPRGHGEFTQMPFWKESFWTPKPKTKKEQEEERFNM